MQTFLHAMPKENSILHRLLCVMLILACSASAVLQASEADQAAPAPASVYIPPGPDVGSIFPGDLALMDEDGDAQNLKTIMGKKGVAIFFVRSADWCPFCKRQLVDVNGRLGEFKAHGLGVVSVSMDTVEKIAKFHQAQSIGFTMLADANGEMVESLGIRDLQYADGSKAMGVARPMIFILSPERKVMFKYAEESYKKRPDLNKVLADLKGW